MSNKPIGLLDSGVGGLTVLKAVKNRLPDESFVYIGDTKRCPYGNRTKDEIIRFTLEMVQFLMKKNVKMIVIACNTATAHALEIVRKKVNIPVIGVVKPGSVAASHKTETNNIGVLATVSTVDSKFYVQSLLKQDEKIKVKSLACPEFVDIVEKNAYESKEAKELVANKLADFKEKEMDTVILGCTHFPLLTSYIQETLGENITLIDSGSVTSLKVEAVLNEKKLAGNKNHQNTINILTTGPEETFREIVEKWLETKAFAINQVTLERLEDTNEKH
ncbi:glutamate racemase [Alkalibacterium gilvum]|uniref:Glutamate racemase n=1 Tax=Alkalibacterium gilvum TaxID=1130080 RepID=A0A1H6RIH3_9LACT|nr:glutamate racemase [Alkalibacterium gilvum]SEI52327.1 glutamate racemase [Alkalibacterium gilvum]